MQTSNIIEHQKYFSDLSSEKIILNELKLLDGPYIFDIEATAKCNIKCIMCPREKITRKTKTMPPKLFSILKDWLPQDNTCLCFCGMGEPLLNKHLCNYILSLGNGKRTLGIVTNGTLLLPEFIDRLILTNINFIEISFNSLHKDNCEKIMKGLIYKQIMRNLEYLSKVRPDKLRVKLAFTEQRANSHEIEDIKKFAEKLGFEFQHNIIHKRGGHYLQNYTNNSKLSVCGIFPKRQFISCTGDILACCHDLKGDTVIQNSHPF